jgi:hypothetical protein
MAKQNQAGYPVTVIKPFDEREIQSIAAPFVALGNAWKQGQDALTKKQKAIRNREATMYETAYKSLGKIESVDYATFDDNMRNFFDGKVDDYVKIKNNIDSGLINPQEGARSLAYISNMIDEYKTLAPKVLAQAKYMMDNGAGGNNLLSKLNDPNLEILFSKLLEGSGEVTLAEDNNGKMYLKGSGKLDGEDWNYDLNLSEFAKLDGNGDSLAITTVNLDDLGLTDVAKAALEASTLEEQKENGTSIAYTNIDQVKQILSGPMNNAIVDITKGEDFASVWADQIYKDKTVDDLKEENLLWDAADPVKMKTAIDWLINQAVDINVPIQQQVQFEGRGEDGSFDPTSKMIGVDENSTYNKKTKIKVDDTASRGTQAERNYAAEEELFDKLLGSQSSKLFENPEKLYNYIKENRNSFNFTAGTEGVGGVYTAQEKIDELKQIKKQDAGYTEAQDLIKELEDTDKKNTFVLEDKILTGIEAVDGILQQTFDLLTPSDLRNKVTKAVELKKPQERKTKAIEDFIKQIESEIKFEKGAPINPITNKEFKDNEAYKAYLKEEAETRYKVIFPNSK